MWDYHVRTIHFVTSESIIKPKELQVKYHCLLFSPTLFHISIQKHTLVFLSYTRASQTIATQLNRLWAQDKVPGKSATDRKDSHWVRAEWRKKTAAGCRYGPESHQTLWSGETTNTLSKDTVQSRDWEPYSYRDTNDQYEQMRISRRTLNWWEYF